MKIYVTSDHHFNHARIIEYAGRPFDNLAHMNSEMVARWNEEVAPDDVVYHLGDFGLEGVPEGGLTLREHFLSLNGRKILIRGNHDSKSFTHYYKMGWKAVLDWAVLEYGGATLLLKHIPIIGEVPMGVDYVICGHLHEKLLHNVANIHHPNLQLNVSVEQTDYRPIPLERALDLLRKKVKNH